MNPLTRIFYLVILIGTMIPGCECSDDSDPNPRSDMTSVIDVHEADMARADISEDTSIDDTTEDPCAACTEDRVCVDTASGVSECVCPAGTSEIDSKCEPDEVCLDMTCNGQGMCTDSENGPTCACTVGWSGEFCDACDSTNGWSPDGMGGCTDDLCTTIQCGEKVCEIENGTPMCVCPAGSQLDENGACKEDEICTPSTCNQKGTCTDTANGPICMCETGWVTPNCQTCDANAGFHDDAMGGCTTDLCLPNPCNDPNRSDCTVNNDAVVCGCDPGFHLENAACVVDEICEPATCSNNGSCTVMDGRTSCMCNAGYLGDSCDTCDAANGYHDDGTGVCTTDLCLPNPCDQIPNKSECSESNGGTQCGCDAGYHDDGAGGCTMDPCLPDLCLATNQSCRVTNNQPECFTPQCDDGNPCTVGSVVNGMCNYVNENDGTTCATDACTVGEVCSSGICGGGAARICDDANPCTDDVCDPGLGCDFSNDDTNVPDDGIGCTDDLCLAGFESHTPSNLNCDDNLFCNGIETCQPANQNADAQGCVVSDVPMPPANPGPCASYNGCDESSDSFPLTTLPNGATCNDGIFCTTGDTCDAVGTCLGTPTPNCGNPGIGSCASTTPYGDINIFTTQLTTNITINGQPLVDTNDYTTTTVYAVDTTTGTRHPIAYWYKSSGFVEVYATEILPGTYDVLYRRGISSDTDKYAFNTDSADDVPNSMHYLQRNVVVPAGSFTFNVDIPVTNITTNITIDGQPLVDTNDYTTTTVYAVDVETGTRHPIAYWYKSSGFVEVYGERLIPGTYDILYRRGISSDSDKYAFNTDSSDDVPNSMHYLQRGVVVSGASHTFNVDIPVTNITTNITIDGQPLTDTNDYTTTTVYAVDVETGTRHPIAYWYKSSGFVEVYGERLIPGTYDILYRRGISSDTDKYAFNTDSADDVPNSMHYLQRGVVVSGASHTFNVDIPVTNITTNITIDGQPLVDTNDYTTTTVYAVDVETGTRHPIAYWYKSSGFVEVYGERLIPGTYDILYRRGISSDSDKYAFNTDSADDVPNSMHYLQRGIVVSGASHTFNVDIPITNITTNITIDGQALVDTNDYTTTTVYAVDVETGTRHPIAYWYKSSGFVEVYGERLIPGTYDILYRRGISSDTDRYAFNTDSADDVPNAMRYLQRGVVVSGVSHTFNVNIPTYAPTTNVFVNGQPLPETTDYTTTTIYAVAADTGTRHPLAYWYRSSGFVEVYGEELIPGDYHILYRRGISSDSDKYGFNTDSGDSTPNGMSYLAQCVSIP